MSSGRSLNGRAAARSLASRRNKFLLVGSQDNVRWCARRLQIDPGAPAVFAGALLTDAANAPERIGRIPVYGGLDALENVIAASIGRPIETVLLCGPIEPRPVRRSLIARAASLGLRLQVAEDRGGVAEVRNFDASDLIGAGALSADEGRLSRLVTGRRILVTGAGGSIGSQLCRRIARLSPARLTLLDTSEFNLFAIHHEIQTEHPRLPLTHALCNVRDEAVVQRWFQREQPQCVFHAAALKHLSMVESHPSEGVLTNVLGTRIVAQASVAVGAHMLLVSTDKAVDPSAAMGATKRLAELYCQALDLDLGRSNGPRVISARLGNVLGSTGSVIPIFERQIAAGGPVTVTDPDATRYFITIPQSADFLLTAMADSLTPTALRGGVHVVDMGDPIRILDLARDLIGLAGHRPDIDMKVSFIGLRDGEKIHEHLVSSDEWIAEQREDCGLTIVASPPRALRVLDNALDGLIEAAHQRRDTAVRSMLTALAAPSESGVAGAALAG